MEVVIDAPDVLASLAAGAIEELLARKPGAVLGLATGSSPLGIYDELVRRHREGRVTFSRARAFLLDEYVGLPASHPQRYRTVIDRELVSRVDFRPEAVHGPDGTAEDVVGACARYEAMIAEAGGVDLQILGIGADGHVGFNEPASSLGSRTRIKTLTEQTRSDNARFFDDDVDQVPTHCLTQGLATIMDARHLVLIATGPAKAAAPETSRSASSGSRNSTIRARRTRAAASSGSVRRTSRSSRSAASGLPPASSIWACSSRCLFSLGRAFSSHCRTAYSGRAPVNSSITSPSTNSLTAGMPRMR